MFIPYFDYKSKPFYCQGPSAENPACFSVLQFDAVHQLEAGFIDDEFEHRHEVGSFLFGLAVVEDVLEGLIRGWIDIAVLVALQTVSHGPAPL